MAQEMIEQLEAIAQCHCQQEGFTPRLIECRANTLASLLQPGDVLDLGCGDGLLTRRLAEIHRSVVAVDASATRLARAVSVTSGYKNVHFVQALFENLEFSACSFDGIVMSCVLEHVPHPCALLRAAAAWLKPTGRIVAIVPNALSLHRRAGVLMGLLRNLSDRSQADSGLGHERVYDICVLIREFEAAGLRVVASGGHLLKPLPNAQMIALQSKLVDAFEQLGRQFPELAAEVYVAGMLQQPAPS